MRALAFHHEPTVRFRRRGLVVGDVERLAHAIAGGLDLDWSELGPDSQSELRTEARDLIARLGSREPRR